MALVLICDGCEKPQDGDEPFKEFGLVRIKSYCPTCSKGVARLLLIRDEAHEALVYQWERSMGIHTAVWKEKHPNGSLPDEP